jgi:hypothetical protein
VILPASPFCIYYPWIFFFTLSYIRGGKEGNAVRHIAVVVLAVLFFLGFVEQGIAGPFGLSMGMKPTEVGRKLEKLSNPGGYKTTEVPQSHSAFKEYMLLFGPKTGLCKIVAMGPEVATSVYGRELRSAFDKLEERLKVQYGKNKKYDSLEQGSVWNEPKDFMMGLLKKERTLVTFWTMEDGATLKDNIGIIELVAKALSLEKGILLVSYDFQNIDECHKELEATEDDAL